MHRANAEVWKAVDEGVLRALAIGGRPRRILRLDPELTKMIPTLRSPRGRGFTFLRQSNPAYHQLASWFGPLLHSAVLAFSDQFSRVGNALLPIDVIASAFYPALLRVAAQIGILQCSCRFRR